MLNPLLIIHAGIAILCIIHLILYGTRPTKSFSWLLVLLLLPFIGLLLYILFGINRHNSGFFQLHELKKRKVYDTSNANSLKSDFKHVFTDDVASQISQLNEINGGMSATSGNSLEILDDGEKAFQHIFDELAQARYFIHIQFYIFEEGTVLERLFQLFEQKIAEGVEIRVIYDAIGSYQWRRKSIKRFKKIGVKIHATMPLRFGSLLFTLNHRNHRKIIVVDGVVGFTGGINISDKYIEASDGLGVWDDMHIKIKGPAVKSLNTVFIKDYYFASGDEGVLNEEYVVESSELGNKIVQILASGPDTANPSILQLYIKLINVARKNIYIANPYFIPSAPLLEALKIAALSGVSVNLLVPEKSDINLVKHSMFSFFDELLQNGVHIYLHPEKFLHSKFIVVDNEITSIGSGNFDNRSFEQNFEVNAVIYNKEIAKKVGDDFLNDCYNSKKISLNIFKKRSLGQRFVEGFARLFSPLM
ncbi:cardiolipin synthase [Spongiivirga sp. MCCC 1A20706]|uniref:cardiolipin synthase n=1 Tax=Spongiivirga sp. MCCC 1A20706 TaxID=3160963 RepID=UPI0039779D09